MRYLIVVGVVSVIGVLLLSIPTGVLVTRVIDGDTLELENGERVRLLGIDTPERGQPFAKEATLVVRSLVEGKRVTLEAEDRDRDVYDRLLRHVFVDGIHLNQHLLEHGLATTLFIEPVTQYEALFLGAESSAREQQLGVWAVPPEQFCFSVFYAHTNAWGNDNENLNDEYVVFRNKCAAPLFLGGWVLSDATGTSYVFPPVTLLSKHTITVHTGEGNDNETDLFWGLSRAVWNNDGDTVTVREGKKERVNYTYPF